MDRSIEFVNRPLELYLSKEIFLVLFCNVILSRVIGPRLSLSLSTAVHSLFFQEPASAPTTRQTDCNTGERNKLDTPTQG